MSWLDADVSLFRSAVATEPTQTLTPAIVLNAIQRGDYQQSILRLRRIRTTRGTDNYNAAKKYLPAVTFGGTFDPTRAKRNLVQHSGVVHGDLDHLADAQAVKQLLCANPYTCYCFTSPSGDGLKLGVLVMPVTDDEAYKHAWQVMAYYYQQHYSMTWDPSGKDICRLCFVSWDPDLYVNPAAQCFPLPPVTVETPRPLDRPSPRPALPLDRRDDYARQALDTAVKMIDASTPGNRHFWRRKAAYLLGGYVAGGLLTADQALDALAAAVQRNTAHLQPSLKTVEACLEAGMQAAITLEHLEQERRQWLATHWHTHARIWTGQLPTRAAQEIPPWH